MDQKPFFGPLTLHQNEKNPLFFTYNQQFQCSCVLCEEEFSLPDGERTMLTHLFMEHKLVIGDVNQIADLKEYLNYWRIRFRDESLPYFCTTMLLDNKPDGTKAKNEEYYLLSDALPEEKELRANLQQKRLENLLERHQFEREDNSYKKECLFCRFNSDDTRVNYLKHLYEKHNFHIAKPDNLIFIDELIDLIAKKLDKLQCIFCEKMFKDRTMLKEHMRKKGHKRLNPDNKEYDKFFLVNYLGDKTPDDFKSKNNHKHTSRKSYNRSKNKQGTEEQNLDNNDSDPEWSDWHEENGPLITCLLCDHADTEYDNILDHMERQHNFAFTVATSRMSFYHKIKIVNFIRRRVHMKHCLSCEDKFENVSELEKHLKEKAHFTLNKDLWDQPEYYFPTYEDDLFLCFIQDEDESWWSSDDKETEDTSSMSSDIPKEMALSVLSDS